MKQLYQSLYYKSLLQQHKLSSSETLLHMHYGGTQTIDNIAYCLNIPKNKPFYLLDIGSGFGAPARYLVNTFKHLHIDCVEVNRSIHLSAIQRTRQEDEQVQGRIHHMYNDIVSMMDTNQKKTIRNTFIYIF